MSAEDRRQRLAIIADLEGVAARVIQKITLDVTANLIADWPVKTGWSRANWVPRIGAPTGQAFGTPDAVTEAPQQAGVASVLGYKLDQGTVFVSNNVPYVPKLDAQRNLVEPAIEKAIRVDLTGTITL